jgi:phenylalanyl-tRNA synthetase alpha chain
MLARAARRVRLGHRGYAHKSIAVRGSEYETDSWTNVSPAILQRISGPSPLLVPNHPLAILKSLIERALPDFTSVTTTNPVVSVAQNFDELAFPMDHPGRSRTDSYYINQHSMLQTHTSAHEVAMFRRGTPKWILTADVYRRDEIDASHYPVFHQTEGARLFPLDSSCLSALRAENSQGLEALLKHNIIIEDTTTTGETNSYQSCHDREAAEAVTINLKLTLNHLITQLFSSHALAPQEPLQIRWIDAYFPFTSPSFEVEVLFNGKWLEILGCGVVKQSTLDTAS